MAERYQLERWLWTEADFETMGWHDSRIYAIAFAPEKSEILFDIDYIFQWIAPANDTGSFSFWVAPATLIFENVYNSEFDLASNGGELEISEVKRTRAGVPRNAQFIGKNEEWIWTIECQKGEIRFRSAGYQMHVRAHPEFGKRQTINSETRRSSFERSADS